MHRFYNALCMEFIHQVEFIYLPQVEFEHVADVVRGVIRQLHQLFAILKGLAQFLHTRLGTIHAVDALHREHGTTHTNSTCSSSTIYFKLNHTHTHPTHPHAHTYTYTYNSTCKTRK